LRVQAVGRKGARSRVVSVTVRVLTPVPRLATGAPLVVGDGAGAPAVGDDTVSVPTTADGRLVRVTGGRVAGRTLFATGGTRGFLDSAVAAGKDVWAASDAGAVIARIDGATGALGPKLTVANRPGGLTEGGGFVWAFHFLQGTVTRIDEATATAKSFETDLSATGIAYGDGAVWLLGVDDRIVRLDPATGRVARTIRLQPTLKRVRSFIETWWLAYGDGALWATFPNGAGVTRIDASTGAARYLDLSRFGTPFGVTVGGGSAWVATERAAVRLDGGTGAVQAAVALPPAAVTGFVSIGYGQGAAWLTNYDRGTLVRVG
jgi:streptogramin lyase